jgi:cell division transport system ATP-binding protein
MSRLWLVGKTDRNAIFGVVIALKQVSRWYSDEAFRAGKSSRVLDQLELDLKKGEFLYVIGGTGAGKSTLLRMLSTEESPSAGTISLFGYELSSAAPGTLRSIRQAIAHIPQKTSLVGDLSVFENVSLAARFAGARAGGQNLRARVVELLDRLGLGHKKDSRADCLSGGEAQRVSIAQALVRKPELILADEPTGAQDPDSAWGILDLLLKENLGGSTVVVATHDRDMVRRVRKRTAVLKGGRIQMEDALCRS